MKQIVVDYRGNITLCCDIAVTAYFFFHLLVLYWNRDKIHQKSNVPSESRSVSFLLSNYLSSDTASVHFVPKLMVNFYILSLCCIIRPSSFCSPALLLFSPGTVFTGYYQKNPPGVYFSLPTLFSLLWALLKAGMLSDVFSVLSVSLAHDIVVSVAALTVV